MLDRKYVRENLEVVLRKCEERGIEIDFTYFLELDKQLREVEKKLEILRKWKKEASRDYFIKMKSQNRATECYNKILKVNKRIKNLEKQQYKLSNEINNFLENIPNIHHSSVPIGKNEKDNLIIKSAPIVKIGAENYKPHWELGKGISSIDIESGTNIAGSRFTVIRGEGAKFFAKMVSWIYNHFNRKGYEFVILPALINETTLKRGSPLHPKRKRKIKRIEGESLYLLPNGLTSLIALNRDEIIEIKDLPRKFFTISPYFTMSHSYGKDSRGLLRLQQFYQFSILNVVLEEESYRVLERVVSEVEEIFKKLGLPYRIVSNCSGYLEFVSSKSYEFEVWFYGIGKYKFVGSVSNFEDYLTREIRLRYKIPMGAETGYPHLIGGNVIYLCRLISAIIEAYQDGKGGVKYPELK